MGRSIGDSGLVCQEKDGHIMLTGRGLALTRAYRTGIVRERKGEQARDLLRDGRLPFARDPIPSEGPRPEAVARVEGGNNRSNPRYMWAALWRFGVGACLCGARRQAWA
jgi:hypothetical protein